MTTNDRQDLNRCPTCGSAMATKHSRRIAGFIERRRTCKSCAFKDAVLVQPETIVSRRHVLCGNAQRDAQQPAPLR